ncbi:MAG: hypothetical protein ACE5GW_00190, partial [Planctomycetota bacterium]
PPNALGKERDRSASGAHDRGRPGIDTVVRPLPDPPRDPAREYLNGLRRRFGLPSANLSETLTPSATAGAERGRDGTTGSRGAARGAGPITIRAESDAVRELRRRFGISRRSLPTRRGDDRVSRPGDRGTRSKERRRASEALDDGAPKGRIIAPGMDARSEGKGRILYSRKSKEGEGSIATAAKKKLQAAKDKEIDPANALTRVTPSLPPGVGPGGDPDAIHSGVTVVPPVSPLPPVSDSEIVVGGTIQVPHYHSHQPWYYPAIPIAFPYLGYYFYYGFPYLYHYGCDFYSGFNLRFGRYHLSLYSPCGYHSLGCWHPHHHHHRVYCGVHGHHYYRLRDCDLCYPYDSTIVITRTVLEESAGAEERLRDLAPGEMSFCEGWSLLRAGAYEEAAQAFYNASLELPESALVHLFLTVSLAGAGEIELAGATLGEAYRLDPSIVGYRWDAEKHMGTMEHHDVLLAAVAGTAEALPESRAAWLLLSYLHLITDDETLPAERAAAEVILFETENRLARGILDECERRRLGRDPGGDYPPDIDVLEWLLVPSCEGIPSLKLHQKARSPFVGIPEALRAG